jgi:hypothetical protein
VTKAVSISIRCHGVHRDPTRRKREAGKCANHNGRIKAKESKGSTNWLVATGCILGMRRPHRVGRSESRTVARRARGRANPDDGQKRRKKKRGAWRPRLHRIRFSMTVSFAPRAYFCGESLVPGPTSMAYTAPIASSKASIIKSASAEVMHIGGAIRIVCPHRPPLPRSSPSSRAFSTTWAHSSRPACFVV